MYFGCIVWQNGENDGNKTDFEDTMKISYKKLWHLLIDKNMTKTELQKTAGLSWASVAKLNRGKNIGTGILLRICKVLDCKLDAIMEIEEESEGNK